MDIGEAKLKVVLALAGVGTTSVLQRAMVDFDTSYAIFSVIGNIIIYLLIILSDKEEKPKKRGELKYWSARLALGAILSVLLTKFISDKIGLNDILVSILIGVFCENFRELIEISKKVGVSAWEGFLERILKGKKDGE